MRSDKNSAAGKGHRLLFLAGVLCIIASLCVFPVRVLVGALFFANAQALMQTGAGTLADSPTSEGPFAGDPVEIQRQLESALAADPGQARYSKALADLHFKLGKWSEVMAVVSGSEVIHGFDATKHYAKVQEHLRHAIELEPFNAGHYLAFGMLQLQNGETAAAQHFATANALRPVDVVQRYIIARGYLLAHLNDHALAEARAMASNDDSYRLPEGAVRRDFAKTAADETESSVKNSYLYRALEIAWRASDRDRMVVRSIVPLNDEALEVADRFFEDKGLDE
ncbi:MAG: hypothetical protein OEW15_03055 [Nitrospirota bacterium]|nr:hypothetical protein [Nitrospirota bacterium]